MQGRRSTNMAGGAATAALLLAVAALALAGRCACFAPDYKDALRKSILFFEGQRSGRLPRNQRMAWRGDSALHDGKDVGVDLVGGYYDAGDNVKFGFPMAFSTTVLAWSILEFWPNMGGELYNARVAVRWATDYLLKATSRPNTIYIQVGQPYEDHNCWQRPEDMDTPRTVYAITPKAPGSEVAAETAAALAAASMVFRRSNPSYASTLLTRAISIFDFGNRFRGSYSQSLGQWVCPFYCDYSGYNDELVWGALWLYKATNDNKYLQYVQGNIGSILGFNTGEFGWDDKHAGIYVLLSEILLRQPRSPLAYVLPKANEFACSVLPQSPVKTVRFSKGGLMFKPGNSNLQHPTALSFLLVVYARYLRSSGKSVSCGRVSNMAPSILIDAARKQVDYILGNNPLGMSYMVGFGNKFPQRIHHRGSSLPSIHSHPTHIPCHGGTPYFESRRPNPNVHVGALVGGPLFDDSFPDVRAFFNLSEPTTYINAPMVGLLAYFASPN